MDTRGKTNAKFRNEVNEILARHKTNFDQLSFPKFNGNDPTGWIYEAKQYFEFKNITPEQQVQLASFHLEGIALQWHRIRNSKSWLLTERRQNVLDNVEPSPSPFKDFLPVAACRLVLGVQWLATLGPIKTDYKQLTMSFNMAGTSHTFQGLGRTDIEALTDKEFNGLQGTKLFFK
ncbi:hypothetical protein CK203_008788 [Vitis vinifera]|uniref:Retrotransposon gag domain-containing protein n=1 Tax=Vitis vinifera TaxID=29760 RepID=A0A438KE28_VITVI|nr:hypothetical protein CK203_008788 [Vitis vinifera]